MLTLNQTVGKDNELIWFYRGTLGDGTVIYLTDYEDDLTLSHLGADITYDGYSTKKEENIIEFNYDFISDKATNSVSNITLTISRNSPNSLLDGFCNEFYPNTTKYLANSYWELGIGWEGITDYEEITWLYDYYCYNFSQDYTNIVLELYSYDLYNVELPKHIVQKDDNTLNFYFPNAPQENLGECIPVVYGDFSRLIDGDDYTYELFDFAPTICVDEEDKTYCYASHEVFTDYYITHSAIRLYRYSEDIDTFFKIDTSDGESKNGKTGAYTRLIVGHEGALVTAGVILRKIDDKRINSCDESGAVKTVTLGTYGSYMDINLDYDKLTDSTLGVLSKANNADIAWVIRANTTDGNEQMSTLISNPYYSVGKSDDWTLTQTGSNYNVVNIPFAQNHVMKSGDTLPHTIDEIKSWTLRISNITAGNNGFTIQACVLELKNILLYHVPIVKKYRYLDYPTHSL